MGMVGDVVVRLGLNATEFQQGLKKAETNLKGIGKNITSAGKTMSTALAVPMMAMGAGVIKVGSEFEASMSKVKALTGANGQEMSKLNQTALDLGSTTKYSASQVADGMSYLGQAGFKTNEILASMDGMLSLASAGGLELGAAADIASNILTGFGMSADQAGHMADVLAYASANSNTNVQQLGDAMKYLAPTAKSLGWNLEDTTSAVMALSDAGIQGEMAGASFGTSLMRLAKPTKEMQKVMDATGLSFFDAQGQMKPLPQIISEMQGATKNMTAEQKASTLSTLFGAEAYKSWAVLLDKGGDGLKKNSQALQEADGVANKMATTMNDNLKGAWNGFTSALQTVAIQIYNLLLPALNKIVENATKVVTWFSNLDNGTKKLIVTIGLVGAGVAVAVLALGMLITGVGQVAFALNNIISVASKVGKAFKLVKTAMNLTSILSFVLSPAGLIIAGILALIAVGILIWKNWDTIKAKAIEIWGAISDFFSSTWESIKSGVSNFIDSTKEKFSNGWQTVKDKTSEIFNGIIDFIVEWGTRLLTSIPLVAVVMFIVKHWDEIKQKTMDVWNGIKDFLSNLWDSIKSVATDTWDSIKQKTTDIWNSIKDFFSEWGTTILAVLTGPLGLIVATIVKNWDTVKETTKIVWDMIKALIQVAWNGIKSVVSTVVSWISDKISTAWNAISSVTSTVFSAVSSFLSSVWNGIKSFLAPIVDGIKNKITTVWNQIKSTTSTVFNAVKSVLTTVWNSIKSVVTSVATAVWNAVTKAWNQIKSTTSSIFNSVKSVVTSVWNSIKSTVTSVATAIWSAVKNKFNQIKSTVTTIFNAVKSVATSVWNSIKSTITSVASAIWSAVSNKFNQIKSTVTSIFNSIKSTATTVWNGIKSTISNVANGIKTSVSNAFNKIKSAMTKPVEDAKNKIKGMLDKIKGFFSGLKLTIPKPKIPKIGVSAGHKSVGGVDVPYPKFDVSWNAKGNIFNGASLLGGNQGVGEAGAEVVMPIQRKRYMKPYASLVADLMNEKQSGDGGNTINNHFNISQMVIREEADIQKVAEELDRIQRKQQRAKGQFAF
ncbi:phage tail tape measure protein [Priestia megaterium]|uniref:phage tail tape measure protein n=1 Tax=Priestia megaterium TaxID=1404 RepID=UPI0023DB3D3A|nr:phage tail tape measure protein [Priestia megaterium]MDF2010191.1 phage tail tape measure protein [Priestia megaterium]